MITVISGTHRKSSKSSIIAKHCVDHLVKQGLDAKLIDFQEWSLADLEHKFTGDSLTDRLKNTQDELIVPANKIIYVLAEYNGGVPGFMKLFIDAISMRKYADNFKNKKALLIGVSSGRGGNSRGLESFTGVLNYLGTNVYPNKLPISTIEKLCEGENINDPSTTETLSKLLEGFVSF